MSWTFKNSSNELAEVVWSASPTSGVIEPFGEIVVESFHFFIEFHSFSSSFIVLH